VSKRRVARSLSDLPKLSDRRILTAIAPERSVRYSEPFGQPNAEISHTAARFAAVKSAWQF